MSTAAVHVTIQNRLGLHARPATLFVEAANNFTSEIHLQKEHEDQRVDGKSIMGLMMLAAERGARIEITAEGPDADAAVAALRDLVDSKFEEE